ncbi:tRNA (adenosine(37)-N6)-threonylcarbamoyltransferase complex dimerization subunit type 1 TsaB [Microbacterium sp. zg.Y1090]|uniref:tRNA (adenosine(37)-N6)-threonylcarbamoyltransferase complex dimerization subunit type 1 TsaB n=1 Tax=Microbacterium TaxID=33882 RepID=UPI00214B0BE6|nr:MULTISPECIES: tRNA (adenosine(37)-N6)-threonylcarbamoyltransferase complex dimerization subunit type 1 TsaB [unclassified Microbacterium]MCR2814098.1 tRNA (adenosine(37)-N6)-threonylcarbamoyltransferase complex dimerization subunit type 1 TsaB [Microbacterium sp. zg.Y1084]MCR2817897.1 tRNA (adenosine(37)-N6)-threonylcarbamoyltransferase complex dimerization subunit type 1 TsaB [Microbacterium sp. zg.Y1090]MDL5487751.1 tRNA (adenosine(37)-N6)-threonylcarbamoyltransferase complex dimerization s
MILGIDTSLGTALAIVEDDGVVRASAAAANPLGHAEVIGDLLRQVLDEAAYGPVGATGAPEPVALTHVAAGMGPGPFTGLRVGIAAATAFALARGIPLVPVPSHHAVALEVLLADAIAGEDTPRFAVVTDARRREFAYSVYEGMDDDGLPVCVAGPALVPRDDLDARLGTLDARRHDATAVPATLLALVAARTLAAGRPLGPAEPLYLRTPDVSVPAPRKKVGA